MASWLAAILLCNACGNLREIQAPDAAPGCGDVLADFDSVTADQEPIDAGPYLEGFGFGLTGVSAETRIVIAHEDLFYDGLALRAASPPNVMTQIGSNDPVSFTVTLCAPARRIRFARAKLIAGPSGVIHPEWSAHGLDVAGAQIALASEPAVASYADVPATLFSLDTLGMVAVRFDSSNEGATFSALVLDDFEVELE
jgi:hypothetical protein